jgi:hypothetical protein
MSGLHVTYRPIAELHANPHNARITQISRSPNS